MSGKLKHLFHVKSDIVNQWLFNINFGYALMYPKLGSYESHDVMKFIRASCNKCDDTISCFRESHDSTVSQEAGHPCRP